MKKTLAMALSAVLLLGAAGCGEKKDSSDAKTQISICWPAKNSGATYDQYEAWLTQYTEKYPDVEVVREDWQFSTDTFLPKAASGTLPTLYSVPFTEVDKVVSGNYVADITKQLKDYGYTENLSDEMLEYISRDGKQYFIPVQAYVMGLFANRELLEKAGELDENGLFDFPDTYEELGELAGRIKKKTGQAGFIMPTMSNVGGWHFLNIAWSFGAEFMKQENGKWVATFDSPECAEALQFVKDLKWKYDALSDNIFIDYNEMFKMFTQSQGAMFFASPTINAMKTLKNTYDMDKELLTVGTVPSGPKGKYAVLGGNLNCLAPGATEEQKNAVFNWQELMGNGAKATEEFKAGKEAEIKAMAAEDCLVGIRPYNLWKQGEVYDFTNKCIEENSNINADRFKEYVEFKDVQIRGEEPVNCQELYGIIDTCIQEVLTNKDADVKELLKKAASDFQLNYLDKAE